MIVKIRTPMWRPYKRAGSLADLSEKNSLIRNRFNGIRLESCSRVLSFPAISYDEVPIYLRSGLERIVPSPQTDRYAIIINALQSAIAFVTINHLFYAANCGEDYFPSQANLGGKYVPMLLLPPTSQYLEDEKARQIGLIIDKITANMNIPIMTINFELNFPDSKMTKILDSFRENASALIWSSEAHQGSAKVNLTY